MLPEAWESRREQMIGRPLVLLAGEDPLLADWAITSLGGEDYDEERIGPSGQQLREAVELTRTASFFGRPRLVVASGVIALAAQGRISQKDREDELEELRRYAERPDRENRLILHAPSVDRRRRAFLDLDKAGAVLPCDPPEAKELDPWLRHLEGRLGVRLSPGARAAYLRSELNLMALSQALLVGVLGSEEGEPVSPDVAQWAAPQSGDLRVFALTDAMLMRESGKVCAAVENLLLQNESPIGLVALIARQFRLLARAQVLTEAGARGDEIARALAVHPFVARKVVEAVRRWPREDIQRAFEELLRCDIALKSGVPQAATLELSLLRISRAS